MFTVMDNTATLRQVWKVSWQIFDILLLQNLKNGCLKGLRLNRPHDACLKPEMKRKPDEFQNKTNQTDLFQIYTHVTLKSGKINLQTPAMCFPFVLFQTKWGSLSGNALESVVTSPASHLVITQVHSNSKGYKRERNNPENKTIEQFFSLLI